MVAFHSQIYSEPRQLGNEQRDRRRNETNETAAATKFKAPLQESIDTEDGNGIVHVVPCPQERTALHPDLLQEGSLSKDLPEAGESFQASPARTSLGSPWRVAQPDLGPAAAPLLRVMQNQQRGHMPVPGACRDGYASFLLDHSTLVRAHSFTPPPP